MKRMDECMLKKLLKKIPAKAIPGIIVFLLIAIIILVAGAFSLIKKYTPSKERKDLAEYYNLSEDSQTAIILNNKTLETFATVIEEKVYLDYNFVHEHINPRFYWDTNENILLYATAKELISANAEATNFLVGKSSQDYGRVIVKATAESALIDIDFLQQYSNFSYAYYEKPNRVVITNDWAEIEVASAKKDSSVRYRGGIKSPILSDVKKGDSLTILKKHDKWTEVCTKDGIIGYIQTKQLKNQKSIKLESNFEEEQFAHIKKEEKINLLWHQVTGASANNTISNLLSNTKGVNVVAPTWFKIKDNKGNISSIASSSYVSYCHDHNVDVWPTLTNFESPDVDSSYILTHTSARQNLVNQIIALALQYNLDGINIDLESMNGDKVGDGYIQFLRELSIKCENNDIILSTDVPVPAAFNKFYSYKEQSNFVDYIIVMGYDQHYGQESGEGSVASLSWTNEALDALHGDQVPSDQIVLGIPFYTKLWKLTPTSDEAAETEYIIGFSNLTMTKAKQWMNNNVAEPTWLDDCGQWYGEVTKNEVIYKMWLEDTTSLEHRLAQVNEHKLAGAAFWKYGLESSDAWEIIIKYLN